MRRSYDNIAVIYDWLAKAVYGQILIKARAGLVAATPAGSRILIAGGGTGWELEELSRIHPKGLTITYIDASAKMMAIAAKRNIAGNEVNWITCNIETVAATGNYDVILTPFLLDNFTDERLRLLFPDLHHQLQPGGLWLYCDFQNTNVFWQKAMLIFMYTFFRAICAINATHLPDTEYLFTKYGYKIKSQNCYAGKFITAVVYIKTGVL